MNESNHGGRRDGAGRKPNAERHARRSATFTDRCAAQLAKTFRNLVAIATGATRTTTESRALGSIMRKDVVRKPDGTPWVDGKGKPAMCEVLAHPGEDPGRMIVTRRTVVELPPDFRANELIVDRVMGTPFPAAEEAADILEIRQALLAAIAAIAARRALPPPSDDRPPTITDHAGTQ